MITVLRRKLWLLPAAAGPIATAVHLFSPSDELRTAVTLVTALGCVAGSWYAPTLHRVTDRRPWRMITLAMVAFLIGVAFRGSLQDPGLGTAVNSLSTMAGYVLTAVAVLALIGRRGRTDRIALLDGMTICLGYGAGILVLFVLPAVAVPHRPAWITVIAAVYPLFDVLLILCLLQLAFTTATELLSFRALAASMGLALVGDCGYAWIGTEGHLAGSPALDAPFLLAYAASTVAVLHPSMAGLATPERRELQAWSRPRLTLLGTALCLPPTLAAVNPSHSALGEVIALVSSFATTALLLNRALLAIRSHARAETSLRYQNTHDGLTGLANRRAAGYAVRDLMHRHPGAVRVTAVDLDAFRLVNDTWGHETGDRLLTAVADRLQTVAGPADLLARTGADEFLFISHGTDDDPGDLPEAVHRCLVEPIEVNGLEMVAAASVGLACARAGMTASELLRDADTAMGRAKSEGGNRTVVFTRQMQQAVSDRLQIEMALRHAVERDELRAAYQPVVRVSDGRVVGCEALLRWQPHDLPLIAPTQFIPVAEESGLIGQLGTWILTEAARAVADWHRRGVLDPSFTVSVNVSPRQVGDPALPQLIEQVLLDTGLAADRLVMEVTESAMLDRSREIVGRLHRIRELGVRLSLDDFGTGYSSLSYLSRLPFDVVKLDRSFVQRLGRRDSDTSIVRAVQGIASALDLGLVAEGVETAEQHLSLRSLKIPHAQGWLWGGAVPAADFEACWGSRTRTSGQVPGRGPDRP